MSITFFRGIEKTILKLLWNYKGFWVNKAVLSKKNKTRGIIHSDFKLYYKAEVVKTVQHWCKSWHIEWGNRIRSPEINLHIYSQLIFDKGSKNTKWGKHSFSINSIWKTEYLFGKEWNWAYTLYHSQKSTWNELKT